MTSHSAPRVSVIVAAYNAERYIAAAIESVLGQSYPALECLVVDDGSTDRTADLVRGFGERVRYIRQENAERSAARNNGIAHATGDYLSFLDADDTVAPEKLAEQVSFLEAHPEFDVAYSRIAYFHEGTEGEGRVQKRVSPSGDILKELIYRNFITIHSPLIRRSAIERTDGFDVTRNRFEDWDFFLRLSLSGAAFGFQDRVHAVVRMHEENTIRDRVQMFGAKLSVAEQIVSRYRAELEARGVCAAQVLAFHRADYGRILVLAGRVQEGRALIRGALREDFPYRRTFALFAKAAACLDHRVLVAAQNGFDRIVKGRKPGRKGAPR